MSAKKILVIPDLHITYKGSPEGGVDEKALKVLFKSIPIIKPDEVILIGDVGEWESVSRFRYVNKKRPPLEYQLPLIDKEAKAVNKFLDDLQGTLAKCGTTLRTITIVEGNHEVWLRNFCNEYPYLKDQYLPENLLQTKPREIKYIPYGEYIRRGKLWLYHGGHYSGVNHTRAHALNLGASVMYGHVHDYQIHKVQHLDGVHGAWSIGCLCKMNKPFLKGRPTNWSHNFAVVHVEGGGDFSVDVIDILNGRAWVWGERVCYR